MKYKLDENLPAYIADWIRDRGHDADSVEDEGLGGADDPTVVAAAKSGDRVLLTLDKGLGNTVAYPSGSHAGIILFRPRSVGVRGVAAFVRAHLDDFLNLDLRGRVAVVAPTRVRIR